MSFLKKVFKSFMGAPLFVILFGLIFFGIGFGLTYQQYNLRQNGLRAQGQVVSLSEGCDDEGCSYSPVVRFTTQDGQTITYTSTFSSNPPAYNVGEEVTLFYKPDNPYKALIKGEGGVLRWIFTVIGGGVVALGLYLFARRLQEMLMAGE